MKNILSWVNDAFLKMTWLENAVNWFFTEVINLESDTQLYKGLTFFFYDIIKIFILLIVLIFIASYLQSFFTAEKTRKILQSKKGLGANAIGALLGTVTPFCSCSSIPIFIGFTKAGLPVGVTFSFLISSPLVDLASFVLLASLFNWSIAAIYVGLGVVIAILGGALISYLKMDQYVADFIKTDQPSDVMMCAEPTLTKKERVRYAIEQVKEIISRVWLYIIIGVSIGAFIHGFIPEAWVLAVLGDDNPFSVIIATIVGVPMYADIFGTLPIAEALILKGVGLGTVLAFMMAVTALSLPSMIMIQKVVKPKLFFTYLSIVIAGIILVGYIMNATSHLWI
jgi:uncharacterized membrane protein YraQ (UPF0718 family)